MKLFIVKCVEIVSYIGFFAFIIAGASGGYQRVSDLGGTKPVWGIVLGAILGFVAAVIVFGVLFLLLAIADNTRRTRGRIMVVRARARAPRALARFFTRPDLTSPHRRPAALEAAGGHDGLRSGQEAVGVCRGRGGDPRLLGLRGLRAGLRRLLGLGLRRLGTSLLPGLYFRRLHFRRGLGGGRCRAHRGWFRGRRGCRRRRGRALRPFPPAPSPA